MVPIKVMLPVIMLLKSRLKIRANKLSRATTATSAPTVFRAVFKVSSFYLLAVKYWWAIPWLNSFFVTKSSKPSLVASAGRSAKRMVIVFFGHFPQSQNKLRIASGRHGFGWCCAIDAETNSLILNLFILSSFYLWFVLLIKTLPFFTCTRTYLAK